MKILFDHPYPFLLAHGGFQIQIEQTKQALESIGLEVEWLRWWDDRQCGDVIHYFGRPSPGYIQHARQKGMRVVLAELLTGQGARAGWKLWVQKNLIQILRGRLPQMFSFRLAWEVYLEADACVALTPWEAHLMSYLFNAPRDRVHVVPNGVEPVFLESPPAPRGPWLVCTATITERKRVWELVAAAVQAQTPVWIIGRAYAESDPYAQKFFALAKQHPDIIRYEGAIHDRQVLAGIYRSARGFVLLSTRESLSLSALEAAACGCPLLLSDQPWAHSVFAEQAQYCPVSNSIATLAGSLRSFYAAAPGLPPPGKPKSWTEIARQLQDLYRQLCQTSR